MIGPVLPITTPEEMAAVDAAAPEPVEALIGRAGSALAREAVRILGGTYGRRVVVVAGAGPAVEVGHAAAAAVADIRQNFGKSRRSLNAGVLISTSFMRGHRPELGGARSDAQIAPRMVFKN